MIAYLVLFVAVFFTWSSGLLQATVRASLNSGPWGSVVWNPSGPPQPGDTIVVRSEVWDMPAGVYGKVVIWQGGSLTALPGVHQITGLMNNGDLRLLPGAVMKVSGDVANAGVIRDAGTIELTVDGSVISGTGTISNLVLNAGTGSVIRSESPLNLGTLYIAAGGLWIDSNDITVNGDFRSSSPLNEWGIIATTGAIALNGPVYGSARGPVTLGWVTGGGTPKHPTPPATHGMLGDNDDTVRFAASRGISFSELIGTTVIDSGVVVRAQGIGSSGINTIHGTLRNYGTLTAADDRYHWRIEGDLFNHGEIDLCTIMMTGHDAGLWTDSGTWGRDASLKYRSASSGRLELHGSMILPRLEIGTLSEFDAGVVVDAGANEILVRHSFTSDRERYCRLISDTLVHLRNDADGIVLGNVRFEGFYDSKIGGVFGGLGRTVTMSMPKQFVGPVSIMGTFVQSANARLTVRSTLAVPPATVFGAEVMIDTGAVVTVDGNLTVMRGMRGGGALELIGSGPSLDVRSPLRDSLLLLVGRDTMVAHVSITRPFAVPRMTIHPYSTMEYPAGITVDVTGEFRYRIAVQPGFSMMSAAVRPSDPTPAGVFPGADSVFILDESLGYVEADTILPGVGYWVSFPDSAIIEQRGTIINPAFATDVYDGWNILGGTSVPVDVADIVELLTTGISSYYEFMTTDPTDGYGDVTVLRPGRGYLIRFDGPGIIVRQ